MNAKWGEIRAGEIIPHIKGELISGNSEAVLEGIGTDTRHIARGQLFIALKGERYDGHDFIRNAIEKKVSTVVVERGTRIKSELLAETAVIAVPDTLRALGDLAGWWRKQHTADVVAITGSSGKTTVKEMTAAILGLKEKTLKNMGNFNNLIGLPLTLLRLEQTDKMAVLEMGMNRVGEIGRLTEIADPDIGLITNVARAHLEGVGDLEGVARAKSELLERISPKSIVILNGDDDLLMKAASRFKRKTMTFGLESKNDLYADNIVSQYDIGTEFEIKYKGGSIPVKIKVPGRHNVIDALAASAAAFCLDIDTDHIVEGLERFKGVQGRFTSVSLPGNILLIDDTYNANPSSLKMALDSAREMALGKGRLLVGLGEMRELGRETVPAHLEAGNLVGESGADFFFAMGEHAREMVKGAIEKGIPENKVMMADSHKEMAAKISNALKEGDLILLKGSRLAGLDIVARDLIKRTGKEELNAQEQKDYGG